MRILYFDIDGVLLYYDDMPKTALLNNALQNKLKSHGFDQLACVSGHADMANAKINNFSPERQKLKIHAILEDIFPDKDWFLEHLILLYENETRGRHIDLDEDWFYIDDWAEEFFTKEYGKEMWLFCANINSTPPELRSRILQVDHRGDGSDILTWLD